MKHFEYHLEVHRRNVKAVLDIARPLPKINLDSAIAAGDKIR
jgi:hypothetical protein